MKKSIIFIGLCSLFLIVSCGSKSDSETKQYAEAFKAIHIITEMDNGYLWNMKYTAPIIFVDLQKEMIYANENDRSGYLQKDDNNVYFGKIPDDIPIANTCVAWNGKNWAMLILPLSKKIFERDHLILHEMFHVLQPALGFVEMIEYPCAYLEEKEARINLRLELQALLKAIETHEDRDLSRNHLLNALTIRNRRHEMYSEAKNLENLLELNEGMTEYTSLMMTQLYSKKPLPKAALSSFFADKVFGLKEKSATRLFAYHTISMYGWMLYQDHPLWHQAITKESNLTDIFMNLTNFSKENHAISYEDIIKIYDYQKISQEEHDREAQQKAIKEAIIENFQGEKHVEVKLTNFSFSMDPMNTVIVENIGTVYVSAEFTDDWGVFKTTNGVLLTENYDKILLSPPSKIENQNIEGEEWTLKLNKGWRIEKCAEGWYEIIEDKGEE